MIGERDLFNVFGSIFLFPYISSKNVYSIVSFLSEQAGKRPRKPH